MKINGKFEFLLRYDISEYRYNRWRQTNNPIFEKETEGIKEVAGYEEVHLDYNKTDNKFGGLAVATIEWSGCICSFLVGDLGSKNWYYTVGQYDPYCDPYWNNNIPVDNNNPEATCVWLYIRVDSTFLRVYASLCLLKKKKLLVDCPAFFVVSLCKI